MLLHSLSPSRTLELGIDAKMLTRRSVDETFDAIAGYGLTCAEWDWACAPGLSSRPNAIPGELIRSVAQAAKRMGVRICASSAKFNLLQTAETEMELQSLRILAEATSALESSLLILCSESPAPRLVGHHNISSRKAPSRKAWTDTIATLRRACRIAQHYGIRLAIELDSASAICDAESGERALDELGSDSDHISIALNAASLYRPAMNPGSLPEVIDDALERLGEYVSLARADDPAGPGIVPYSHYLTALVETPAIVAAAKHSQRLPLILRGLSAKDVPAATRFVREMIEALDHVWRSRLLDEFTPMKHSEFDRDLR